MPRNKKRKTLSHGQTEPTAMKAAVAMVLEGADSIRNVAKDTGIAKSTLQRYVNKAKHAQSTGIYLFACYK
ncbi:MAG: helix-turn-helix domain-containing protein [Kangiellaceae bacterium]|jgi:transposase-like protein|nr:helix-turn-helix domain-containing protein [Kangiellaceae bacterium]